MAGRDELLETVRIAVERVRRTLPTKSVLMVGLRGVGKTVLLDRMREDAESTGLQTMRIEAPEDRSLPALLAPEFRLALLRMSRSSKVKEVRNTGLRLSSMVRFWRFIRCRMAPFPTSAFAWA